MKRHLALLVAAVLSALLLGACGSDSEESATETSSAEQTAGGIAVDATEFAFDPAEIEVTANEEFTISVINGGAVEHDFNIEGQEADKIVTTPGQTAEGSFTLPSGEFTFFCSIPGHREAGMEGTLTAAT